MSRLNIEFLLYLAVGCIGLGCSRDDNSQRCSSRGSCPAAAGSGGDDAGAAGASSSSADGGASGDGGTAVDPADVALSVRFEDADSMAIDVVTLACAGDCVDVEAVVRGGHPPYTLEWDDGSTQAIRRVCADAPTELSVRATDTPIHVEEFDYEAQTVTSTIAAHVFECSDGGTCEPGAGPDTPESGRYEGTGTYVCDNDMSAESAMLINHLAVSLDFEIDPSVEQQSGHAFFQWGLVVIAGVGELDGTLECGGALRASLRDGTWGLPGPDPLTVIPAGTVTGEFTARRAGQPGKITGSWHWTSLSAVGDYGNMCNGTYEAQLVP